MSFREKIYGTDLEGRLRSFFIQWIYLLGPVLGLTGFFAAVLWPVDHFVFDSPYELKAVQWPLVIVVLPAIVYSAFLLCWKIRIDGKRLFVLEMVLLVSLAVFYFGFEISGRFGDTFHKKLASGNFENLGGINFANAIGSEILKAISRADWNVNLYSPVVGIFGILASLYFIRVLEKLSSLKTGPESVLARLSLLGTGSHLIYVRNNLEVSQASVPVAILMFVFWAKHSESKLGWASWVRSTLVFYLLCAFHGLWTCILPAWMWISAVSRFLKFTPSRFLLAVLVPVGFGATYFLVVNILPYFGLVHDHYEVIGGADKSSFVPLFDKKYYGTPFSALYLFLSSSHLAEIAGRYLTFAPLTFIALSLGILNYRYEFLSQMPRERLSWLGITVLGILSFGLIHHYDLGFVEDFDLLALTYLPFWVLGLQFIYFARLVSVRTKFGLVVLSIVISSFAIARFTYFTPMGGKTPYPTRLSCLEEGRCFNDWEITPTSRQSDSLPQQP